MFWQIIFFITSAQAIQQNLKEPTCNTQGISHTIRLSLNSTRSQTGVWLDNLSAWTEYSNSSEAILMDIAHTITECQGKRIVHVQGVTQVPLNEDTKDRIKFHTRCAKNVAILNKGLSVQRIMMDDPINAIAFTNRPMKDDEIFEVKIEEKNAKFSYGVGIGIMTKSATDVPIPSDMYRSPFAWMYHYVNIYSNSAEVLKNYGKNLHNIKVGETIGVMRSEVGTLHFFVNGEDQGPAMSNVPPNVYGVLDIRGTEHKASIVYRNVS